MASLLHGIERRAFRLEPPELASRFGRIRSVLPSGAPKPTSNLIADAPQRRQQLSLNGVKEAIDRKRLAPKIAATSGGTGVIQTS